MRYKQVHPTVIVVVAKSRTGGPAGVVAQARLFGDVRKCSIAVIAIENYTPEAGDK